MMDVDHHQQFYEGQDGSYPASDGMYDDPYAQQQAHAVYDDEMMNLDDMPVTQEDAWAVIRSVWCRV
jgi:hypothetical protein